MQLELERLRGRVRELEARIEAQRQGSSPACEPTPGGKIERFCVQGMEDLVAGQANQLLALTQLVTGVALWRWDLRETRVHCSKAFASLFDFGDERGISYIGLLERIHPQDRDLLCFEGVSEPCLLRVSRRDGSVRDLLSTRARLDVGPEQGPVWIGLMIDVTRQQAMERELKHAQKMEALGRLAGGVAHDFNNYLAVVQGNAELLLASVKHGSDRAVLDEVVAASKRCLSLTQQLLALGKQPLVRPPVVDLRHVVVQSKALIGRLLPASIRYELSLPEESLPVRVDAVKLERVVMNLVINAKDAMQEGGQLHLLLTRQSASDVQEAFACQGAGPSLSDGLAPGPWVRMQVIDQGCGMDAETSARIFEPFFTTKPSGRGTGLGLSVVHGVVEQAKGRVAVASRVGHGSTFEVWLPLAHEVQTP